jgi:hypothetical protein
VVDEEVVDGVLVCGYCTLQPERIGSRHVLQRGLVIGQAQAGSREWLASHCAPLRSSRDHHI